MSSSQVPGLCAHSGSGLVPGDGGLILVRLTVEAVAEKPQRDGASQDSWFSPPSRSAAKRLPRG